MIRVRQRSIAGALCVAVAGWGCVHLAQPSRDSRLIAEGPFVLHEASDTAKASDSSGYSFSLPVEIHGRVLRMLVDHGSSSTMLTDSAVGAIRIPHWDAKATRADTLVRRPGFEPRRDSSAN